MEKYRWTIYDFDETRDLKTYKAWVWDMKDCVPPMKPFMKWVWRCHCIRSMEYAAESLCAPTTKGIDGRYIGGYQYLTPAITTEEERRQREPLFLSLIHI